MVMDLLKDSIRIRSCYSQSKEKQRSSKKTRAIINMSLATRSSFLSRSMRGAITSAVETGILVVVAAGNYQTDACQ